MYNKCCASWSYIGLYSSVSIQIRHLKIRVSLVFRIGITATDKTFTIIEVPQLLSFVIWLFINGEFAIPFCTCSGNTTLKCSRGHQIELRHLMKHRFHSLGIECGIIWLESISSQMQLSCTINRYYEKYYNYNICSLETFNARIANSP